MNRYAEEFRKISDPEEIKRLMILVRSRSQAGETEARDYCIALGRVGCPLDLDDSVKWQIQNNKSNGVFKLINSDNPEDISRGIAMLDQLARSGDADAIKYFKLLHVSGCPTDLAGAVSWHLQLRRKTAARATAQPASSGGCMVVVGILVPLAVLTCAVAKIFV